MDTSTDIKKEDSTVKAGSGKEEYRESIKKVIYTAVKESFDEDMRKAIQELVDEQRKALKTILEEQRIIIRQVVDEEKKAIWVRAEELRKSITKLGL